ncbi:MAG: hypothetical protein ABSA92_14910 [Candidatus Bathyarchaeia archaeon]
MDNQAVEIKPGPISQRTYETNLNYERTVTNPTGWLRYDVSGGRELSRLEQICKRFNADKKGKTTFYLKALRPEVPIQITRNGIVMIQSGTIEPTDTVKLLTTIESDEDILRLITPCVVTRDSQRFTWTLKAHTICVKELLQEKPLDAQKGILKKFLNQLEVGINKVETHEYFYNDHSHMEIIKNARKLLGVKPIVDRMDANATSGILDKVEEAITQIDQIRFELDDIQMRDLESRYGNQLSDTYDDMS